MTSLKEEINAVDRIAVVVPCFKCRLQIMQVLRNIPDMVSEIFVIDDACPDDSGLFAQSQNQDPRVKFIFHSINQGVGGAVLTGYKMAIKAQATVIVKLDGDGQMDPHLLKYFVEPILRGEADYTKGNRFFSPESVSQMPSLRIFGNACLSFFSKISSGYWNIFDPTNGYTAIHSDLAALLPSQKISKRYFFESEILFRLNLLSAKVIDIPMSSRYKNEVSGLKEFNIIPEFLFKHFKCTVKRLIYKYFLFDFNIASLQIIFGSILFLFGTVYGSIMWINSIKSGNLTSAGTVMLAALPIIIGFQMIMSAISFDMTSVPVNAVHGRLGVRENI